MLKAAETRKKVKRENDVLARLYLAGNIQVLRTCKVQQKQADIEQD